VLAIELKENSTRSTGGEGNLNLNYYL
jgi:hypothetical protein